MSPLLRPLNYAVKGFPNTNGSVFCPAFPSQKEGVLQTPDKFREEIAVRFPEKNCESKISEGRAQTPPQVPRMGYRCPVWGTGAEGQT